MIKNISKLFNDLATSHLIINSFKTGDYFEIQKNGSDIYPMLFLENDSDTIIYLKNQKKYSVSFYIFEIPREDGSDYLELKNKIETINSEIIQQLYFIDSPDFHEIENVDSIFLKEFSNDSVVGIRTQLTFTILNFNNICESPI